MAEAMMQSIPPTGWGDVATRQDLQAHIMILRGEMAEVRGEIDLRFARNDRTIVIAAIATALSSWGASFAVVGL